MKIVKYLKQKVKEVSTYSKEKSNKYGEVFSPEPLIKEMLMSLDVNTWSDSSKTILDPCAGFGNFPVIIIQGLMNGLKDEFPNSMERYQHIIENQLYMCEYQKESAKFINELFSLGIFKVNLYVGDYLTMPDDFFDLSYEERKKKYPDNTI